MKLLILVGPVVGGLIGYIIALYFRKHSDKRKLGEAARGAGLPLLSCDDQVNWDLKYQELDLIVVEG